MRKLVMALTMGAAFFATAAHLYSQPAGEARNAAGYAVTVDGQAVGVAAVRNSAMPVNIRWPGHQREIDQTEIDGMVRFSTAGKAVIAVTAPRDFKEVKVRPYAKGVKAEVSGRTATFTIPGPAAYSVEFDGPHENLHIFADPPETLKAHAGEKGVRYFGPGEHDVGLITLQTDETLYIDEGAVVFGRVEARDADHIRILGRGILDMSRIKEQPVAIDPKLAEEQRKRGFAITNAKRWNAMKLEFCDDVLIDGITIRDSLLYNIRPIGCRNLTIRNVKICGNWRYNSDGIDMHNCENVRISDCFVRTFDDAICVKGFDYTMDESEMLHDGYHHNVFTNVVIERFTSRGYDAAHRSTGITVDGIYWNGREVSKEAAKGQSVGPFADPIRFTRGAACSDCGARTVAVAQEKANERRDFVDAPGTLRMHAPAARFFRTNGAFRQFKATVGFDPAIHTKHSYGPKHVAGTLMGFRVYADKKLVADTGLIRPGDGTRTIDVDVSGARTVVLESVDGGFWTGTPSLLALWQDVRFVGDGGATLEEDMSGAETPQFGILTPSDEPEPRLNGSWTYGVRPGKPILYRVAVTGEKPLEVSVVGELPKGLAFDAQRRLLTGSLEQRGDYEVVFAARNARGKAERTLKVRVGDKLCLTPPMGWNSWNAWGCAVSDKIVRDTAATFLEKGLADHGWTYVNIDDGWPRSALDANPPATGSASDPKRRGDPRDENGVIRPNGYFPDMKALGDYLHSHGLKFGIYSSPGPRTCNRYEGTYGHDALDAATWASWGVDYVKYDWCYYREIFAKETAGRKPTDEDRIKPFRKLYGELLRQPRDMVYSFSGGGGPKWGEANGSNLWRTWTDLKDGWGCLLNAAKSSARQYRNSHPGFWADPDMLIVGRLRTGSFPGAHDTVLTPNEQYTHLSLWAVMNAPLLLGCQMNVIDDFTVKLLVNPEVIDVDQDVAEAPGRIVFENGEDLVLAKTLCDGSTAICAVNLCPFKRRVTVNFKDAGLSGTVRLRDLWRRKDIGTFQDSFTTELPPHAPLFVRCFK